MPGLVLPRGDAGGRFRYFGAGLDIGAFERGSTICGIGQGREQDRDERAQQAEGRQRAATSSAAWAATTRCSASAETTSSSAAWAPTRRSAAPGNDRIDLRDGKKGNDSGDGGPDQDVCLMDARDKRTSC